MARPSNSERRKREASELLENQTLQGIFSEVEKDIHSTWADSSDRDKREVCHHELKALTKLREKIYAAAKDRSRS